MGWKGAGMVAAGGRRSWFRLAALMLLLVLCWLGSVIPLPGLNQEGVASLFGPYGHGMLRQLSIFALGLGSLLTALAYLEIAKLLFPGLARWQGASADNMFRLNDYVRLAAVAIALFQAYGVAVALQQGPYLVAESQGGFVLVAIATLLGGCALLWWLVDRITLLGFGNGFWLAWVAGIVSGFPRDIVQLADLTRTGWVGTDIWLILAGFLGHMPCRGHRERAACRPNQRRYRTSDGLEPRDDPCRQSGKPGADLAAAAGQYHSRLCRVAASGLWAIDRGRLRMDGLWASCSSAPARPPTPAFLLRLYANMAPRRGAGRFRDPSQTCFLDALRAPDHQLPGRRVARASSEIAFQPSRCLTHSVHHRGDALPARPIVRHLLIDAEDRGNWSGITGRLRLRPHPLRRR